MGTEIEQAAGVVEWRPIETLPFKERPFRFRWADGTVETMDGYDPLTWSEDGHRVEHPVEWAEV